MHDKEMLNAEIDAAVIKPVNLKTPIKIRCPHPLLHDHILVKQLLDYVTADHGRNANLLAHDLFEIDLIVKAARFNQPIACPDQFLLV